MCLSGLYPMCGVYLIVGFICGVREVGGTELSSFGMVIRWSCGVCRTDVRLLLVGALRAMVIAVILPVLERLYPFFHGFYW